MKKCLMFLFQPVLMISLLQAQPISVGPIAFGEGVNKQTVATEIKDGQSTDECNCISNLDGSISKIFGSKYYIEQAFSSQPVTALYEYNTSTGEFTRNGIIAVIGDKIVYSSDNKVPSWNLLIASITPNQKWSFTTMNNQVIMTGDKLTDPIFKFSIFNSSFSELLTVVSTDSVLLRAKYLLQKDNYLLFINTLVMSTFTNYVSSGTYFPSRVYYSLLNQPSSGTYNRYLEIRTNDGEDISGGGVMFDRVDLFKKSSIFELDFSILNLTSIDGNQAINQLVSGYGLSASQGLENIGNFYVMASQDSIRLWDGGRRGRLSISEENKPISNDIKTLIEKLIKAKTYDKTIFKYYKKREWLIMSYIDPDKFPKNIHNSVIIYDLRLNVWHPICGWLASSFATLDIGGNGDLMYGSSVDGLSYIADIDIKIDNAPKQMSVDTMDTGSGWSGTNFTKNVVDVKEGTGSLRLWVDENVTSSSMSIMKVFNFGEWYDKTKIIKDNAFLSFKIYIASPQNIISLRTDLEVNDDVGAFDTNFSSVTLSSSALTTQSTTWTTVNILLSSFPVRPDWVGLNTELFQFSNTPYYYGLRFVSSGIATSSVTIDDVRIVQSKDSPLNFYRFGKMFDFGSVSNKTIGQLLLTLDRERDSNLKIDIYKNFGETVITKELKAEVKKEILVMGITSTASIAILDDSNFSIIESTDFLENDFLPFNGVATNRFIFFNDRTNNRLVKMNRSPFGVILSTYGGLGSGSTNYDVVQQSDLDENGNIIQVDVFNHRVKMHSQDNLNFIKMAGSLGNKTTSYHTPTGITCTNDDCIVADEGNYRLVKISISSFGIISEKIIDYNTIGDSSLEQDSEFVYLAYNKISEVSADYIDVVLEKRFRGDLNLVNRIVIKAENDISLSTSSLQGDIALRGKYIYIPFTNSGLISNPKTFIQKRLKSNFSLVKEFRSPREIFSILGDAFAHKPSIRNEKIDLGIESKYVQLKYYDEGLENSVRLINQTFLVEPEPIKY